MASVPLAGRDIFLFCSFLYFRDMLTLLAELVGCSASSSWPVATLVRKAWSDRLACLGLVVASSRNSYVAELL